MGKGSNTKQRKRRSSAAKTKIPRQNKNSHKAFWRPAKFASEVVKASWNPRISHRQNLAHLGLNPSPNAALRRAMPPAGHPHAHSHVAADRRGGTRAGTPYRAAPSTCSPRP